MIGVTGVRNMLSKSLGSTNKVNIAYASIEALQQLVPREKWLNGSQASVKTSNKPAADTKKSTEVKEAAKEEGEK